MRIFGVVLAASISVGGWAQDPLVTLPQNYKVILDNADVKVIRAHYGAHEKVPVHDHPGVATVFVYLNDSGKVRIDHDGDGAFSVVRPPTVKGSYRVAAAMAERHSIENLGDQPSEFLRVELKRVNLELKEPFRGKAPAGLVVTNAAHAYSGVGSFSEDRVEFEAPGLQIERIVCTGGRGCSVKSSPAPSLLIAFGHIAFVPRSLPREAIKDGGVRWLPASQSAMIGCDNDVCPAHVLRILLPERK